MAQNNAFIEMAGHVNWMDGWTDRRMDGWINRQINTVNMINI